MHNRIAHPLLLAQLGNGVDGCTEGRGVSPKSMQNLRRDLATVEGGNALC